MKLVKLIPERRRRGDRKENNRTAEEQRYDRNNHKSQHRLVLSENIILLHPRAASVCTCDNYCYYKSIISSPRCLQAIDRRLRFSTGAARELLVPQPPGGSPHGNKSTIFRRESPFHLAESSCQVVPEHESERSASAGAAVKLYIREETNVPLRHCHV